MLRGEYSITFTNGLANHRINQCGSKNRVIVGSDWRSTRVVPCSNDNPFHYQCGDCFDLDGLDRRIQHCNGQRCADVQNCDLLHCDGRPWYPYNQEQKPVEKAKSATVDKANTRLAEGLKIVPAGGPKRVRKKDAKSARKRGPLKLSTEALKKTPAEGSNITPAQKLSFVPTAE